MDMSKVIVWSLGFVILLSGIGLAFLKEVPPPSNAFKGNSLVNNDGGNEGSGRIGRRDVVEPQTRPVVTAFRGDLAIGGTKAIDGTMIPFVVGETLSLEAEATNATEYRWSVNGQVITDKDKEWSTRMEREYEIAKAGEHRFAVQVRGSNSKVVSQPKEVVLKTQTLSIDEFKPALTCSEDHVLTGSDFVVQIFMNEPNKTGELYRYRYSVNDQIMKHPDDGKEWTTETDFTYTFPAPGQYAFKVDVRRAEVADTDESRSMEGTITVADAVLLSFDSAPEKFAKVGTPVNLSCFNESNSGHSECRFGVKKISAPDFDWLQDEKGIVWGDDEMTWTPREPGNYLLRAEVREKSKQSADDYRELLFTVTEEDF